MKTVEASLVGYGDLVARSDKLPPAELMPALLGLLGEVGGILTTAKKVAREQSAYSAFHRDAEEEFGDALWYLTAVCRRIGISMPALFEPFAQHEAGGKSALSERDIQSALLALHDASAGLTNLGHTESAEEVLRIFAGRYTEAYKSIGLSAESIIRRNSEKVASRFLPPDFSSLPTFDSAFGPDERLLSRFEFYVTQRPNGQAYMSLNEVFVGDPLGDNMENEDGYRFHDVFHMAHAAVLHWSPVLRALLKRKRKSVAQVDAIQDSGRAIVIEEGLTAWVFARAKEHNMFEGATSVSFDVLKRINEFVRGYEVEACPLVMWERAILQGYQVFRQLSEHKTGIIVGDRASRSISFRPL